MDAFIAILGFLTSCWVGWYLFSDSQLQDQAGEGKLGRTTPKPSRQFWSRR